MCCGGKTISLKSNSEKSNGAGWAARQILRRLADNGGRSFSLRLDKIVVWSRVLSVFRDKSFGFVIPNKTYRIQIRSVPTMCTHLRLYIEWDRAIASGRAKPTMTNDSNIISENLIQDGSGRR